ncbi:MAG: LytTR family DNA-binding domain-containing protein [Clostridiaceae bacterium]|nr:LytTR family DNA-binding domain-containing protein [Clostridiaceae bacterium]
MKIAVCDDEVFFHHIVNEKICEYMKSNHLDAALSFFQSGKDFLESKEEFDIVFMDIELDKENGLNLLDIYRKNHRSINILLTSHKEELPNGYKIGVFRFLLKPICEEALGEALDSALLQINKTKRFIGKKGSEGKIIREDEIIYVEAGDKCTGIRTISDFYKSDFTITKMKEELCSRDFYMPHRSYIVNMNAINKIECGYIYLNNQEKIKVSRLKWKEFKNYFYEFIRKKALHGN